MLTTLIRIKFNSRRRRVDENDSVDEWWTTYYLRWTEKNSNIFEVNASPSYAVSNFRVIDSR